MNWLDIVILVTGTLLVLAGWRVGGLQVGITGLGILAGIALAGHLHGHVEPFFSPFIDSSNWAEIAAFVTIFVLVLLASVALSMVVRAVLSRLALGWLDKAAGLGVGLAVTFAAGSALLSAVQSYPVLGLENTIGDSTLGTFLADQFDTVLKGLRFVPTDLGA